jgi:hypothetical protein
MAEKTQTLRSAAGEPGWGRQHRDIVEAEIVAINTRREPDRQVKYESSDKSLDVVGLTLSGGGIRSAAICLGVLQALNHYDLLKRIDYLSTVSGGGYIGSSLTATMTRARQFAFGKTLAAGPGAERAIEISDTPSVGHIRNYSNYLIPAGARDLLTGMAIVVRGLVANLSLTLPVVLVLAAITIASNPARSSLYIANFFGLHVENGSLFPPALEQYWLIRNLGFLLAGAIAGLLLLILRKIMNFAAASNASTGRSVLLVYLAGIAVAMGLICEFGRYLPVEHFGLTLAAALLGLGLFFLWAIGRSLASSGSLQEFRGPLPAMGATYLVLLAVIAFFEFQPFMIAEMFDAAEGASGQTAGVVAGVAIGWIKSLAAITAPIAAAVTLFRQQFANLLKGNVSSDLTSRILAYGAKAAVWAAGAALPLLIWVGYLYLCYWGIANDKVADMRTCSTVQHSLTPQTMLSTVAKPPANLAGKIQFDSQANTLTAEIASKGDGVKPADNVPVTTTSHAPCWLVTSATDIFGETFHWSMIGLYFCTAVILWLMSWLLTPNANSLHRLYRDRLSKAFLFNPKYYADGGPARNEPSLDQGHDFLPLDDEKLSKLLYPGYPPSDKQQLVSPYHLINTALNIQGSDFANRRGRNADFFVFSPLHVGSEATGYAGTAVFENAAPGLDLATAMAISGAAASSNMGSSSIRPLTPTLALLNVRLGYWLANPRYVDASSKPQHHSTPLYLWSEITGRLYENADAVYLTDGGHIENLGVYELLRRRCKVIIAVDAEADAPMNFSALMTLQRYARIDLGILIDLPWTPIRTNTLGWMNCNAGKPPSPAPVASDGPHVAIGIIDYGGGEKGYLVYIKSSLTGDENDYIRDYARRYNSFPHESTGDQFFSEEQFEVYRALGFHMTNEFLSGDDKVVAAVDRKPPVTTKFSDTGVDSIRNVRAALGLPVAAPAPPSSDVASL